VHAAGAGQRAHPGARGRGAVPHTAARGSAQPGARSGARAAGSPHTGPLGNRTVAAAESDMRPRLGARSGARAGSPHTGALGNRTVAAAESDMRPRLLLRLPAAVLLALPTAQADGANGDVSAVAERLLQALLGQAVAPAVAQKDAAALRPDGSWADVNYNDTTRTGGWSPHLHLQRMQNLAAATRATNDSSLIAPTRRAIDFWLQRDPRSLNWWWNELSVPATIADTALLFQPWIASPHTLAVMVKFMERANYGQRTGANLDDEVATAITRAALLSNHSVMDAAFSRLWYEIRVVQPSGCISPPRGTQGCPTDGIQADRSFHQHGPELLDGSYGEVRKTRSVYPKR
jgi:hypothetical protein